MKGVANADFKNAFTFFNSSTVPSVTIMSIQDTSGSSRSASIFSGKQRVSRVCSPGKNLLQVCCRAVIWDQDHNRVYMVGFFNMRGICIFN